MFKYFNFFLVILLASLLFTSCSEQESSSSDGEQRNFETHLNSIVENLQSNGLTVEVIKGNVSTRSVNCNPEIPSGLICQSLTVFDKFPYLGNDDCPGCSEISVNYEVTICYDPITFSLVNPIYFNNFNASPTGGDCGELWNCWFNMDSGKANRAIEKFLYEVSLTAEGRYMEAVVDNLGGQCPNIMVETEFSRQLCYRTCIKLLNKPPFFDFQLQHCGRKCCKRTRQFCRELSGELFISSPVFEAVDNDSCDDNPVGQKCSFWGTPCYDHPCGTF